MLTSLILDAFHRDGDCWYYYNDRPLGTIKHKPLASCSLIQEVYAPNLVGYRIELNMEHTGNSLFMVNTNLVPTTELLDFGLVLIITQDTVVIVNSPEVVDMHNIYEV